VGVATKTNLGFCPPCRRHAGSLPLQRPWGYDGPRPLVGSEFMFFFMLFYSVFFKILRRQLHLEVRIRSSHNIFALVVRLALVVGAWSCVPGGSRRIWSVFLFNGAVSCQTLPIYGCYHWRWLLLECVGPSEALA
jgi:hypothetical protein